MKKKILASAIIVLTFGAGYFVGTQLQFPAETDSGAVRSGSSEDGVELGLFWDVWRKTKEKFVDVEALDPTKMLYGAIKGVVDSLGDPNSEFLDPTESEEFLDSLEGDLTGIGAEVGTRDNKLVVISPLRGSPAEAAGLLPGDHIFKINDEFSADYSLFEAVKRIRGEPGTQVTLTIFRNGNPKSQEITITRDFIDIESVVTELRPDGLAVVTVATFADDTAEEFTKALADLALKNPQGLILDLRFNGGGFLDAAVEMTSKLLATGNIVTIHERQSSDKTIVVSGAALLPETPLVVLINAGSASSSEIMAGALQDNGRATVIGEQSFGKGTVQELVNNFEDGSMLRITIAKWFTPSGRDVNEEGITPDIEVELSPEDYFAKKDPQLDAAVEFLKTGKVTAVEGTEEEGE
ncbi:MAG: S41 family peptidase [Patescibacteria group bacterium]